MGALKHIIIIITCIVPVPVLPAPQVIQLYATFIYFYICIQLTI